jgi:hypothetical protein
MTDLDRPKNAAEKLAELEAAIAEQDRQAAENDLRHLGALLEVKTDQEAREIVAEIMSLGTRLTELGLISDDNRGKLVTSPPGSEFAYAIEADHPDGTRLYGLQDVDTIVASRVRPDGRYEHAVLDEHVMPTEWRTAPDPNLN